MVALAGGGPVLVALEMAASGGFYVIFFGIAALAIGGLHLLGLAGPPGSSSSCSPSFRSPRCSLFRSPLMRWLQLDQPGRDVDSLVGEIAMPLDDIVPGAVGRAELRGTVWSARNATAHGHHPRPALQGGARRRADDLPRT